MNAKPLSDPIAAVEVEESAVGLADYLRRQWEWSERTFGPGRRTLGVTKHIEKEIAEVRAKPEDLSEWVDIIILAMDGYWRHGGKPEELLAQMQAKQAKNFARQWPAWKSEDEPVEHDRTRDAAAFPSDAEILDWMADVRVFDGLGQYDIDEMTLAAGPPDITEEGWKLEWRKQMRLAVALLMADPAALPASIPGAEQDGGR